MTYCIDRILLESDWILNGKLHCANAILINRCLHFLVLVLVLSGCMFCILYGRCTDRMRSEIVSSFIFVLNLRPIFFIFSSESFPFFPVVIDPGFRHNFIILFDMMHRMLVKNFSFLIFCTISGFNTHNEGANCADYVMLHRTLLVYTLLSSVVG